MGYFVWAGMARPWPVAALAVVGIGGMAGFYAAIRSGANLRCADPSLTVPQMVFALAIGAVAYTLAGRGRGAVFPIMMVILMFGMYSLTPRQMRRLSLLALLLFGAAMALMARLVAGGLPAPRSSSAHFLVVAIMLPAVSMLAGQLSRLRDRLRRQKAELQDALARIQELAHRDELTGLVNRRHMAALIEAERERCERLGGRLCLAVLDIDRFKRINDTHGHPTGDRVLGAFAKEAQAALRGSDVLARWGGEEFMLLMPDTPLTAARLERRAAAHAGGGDACRAWRWPRQRAAVLHAVCRRRRTAARRATGGGDRPRRPRALPGQAAGAQQGGVGLRAAARARASRWRRSPARPWRRSGRS